MFIEPIEAPLPNTTVNSTTTTGILGEDGGGEAIEPEGSIGLVPIDGVEDRGGIVASPPDAVGPRAGGTRGGVVASGPAVGGEDCVLLS